ncbi:MAG: alpha-1,2-fucosyltransferase [Desulfuromonadaceae bacterium]
MIIVKLMGGLGNQMFQYAAARSLSLRHGTALKLDLSYLESDQSGNTHRTYELGHFCIASEKASRLEVNTMISRGNSTFLKALARTFQKKADSHAGYREKWCHYDPQLLTLSDNVYLEGYWQSERYFVDISEVIRKELTVTSPLAGKNRELAEEIRTVNAVSMHVRRGDYVTDKKAGAMHGVCNLDYYQSAVGLVVQSLEYPHFFVFSDDPEWVAENLKLHHPVRYISNNGSMAHEDLRLMSMCKHHVIANSSFSWWGAWLSTNPDKMVIAPKRWFNDPSINTSDLIPSDWQQL